MAATEITPWFVKYRPQYLDEMVGVATASEFLQRNILTPLFPPKPAERKEIASHALLFSGPAGCGKTTIVNALFNEFERKEKDACLFISFNASEKRRLDEVSDIRRRLSTMKKSLVLILADEFDSMEFDAQENFARLVEEYSCEVIPVKLQVLFAFTCNQVTKVTPLLQQPYRCRVFEFSPLTIDDIHTYIGRIAVKEGFVDALDKEALNRIITIAKGDLRYVVNTVQTVFYAFHKITLDVVAAIRDTPNTEALRQFLNACKVQRHVEAKAILESLLDKGYNAEDLTATMLDICNAETEPDVYRLIQEAHLRIRETTADTRNHLRGLMAKLVLPRSVSSLSTWMKERTCTVSTK